MTHSPIFSAVSAVLFDWDFTLAYSLGLDVSHHARTAALFQKFNVNCTAADVKAAQDSIQADIVRGRVSLSLRPQKKRAIIHLYQELLRRLGHPETGYDFAYKVYAEYGRLPHFLFPDVLATLRHLQEWGLVLGILSNHSSSVRDTIKQLIGEIIPQERVIISEEVGIHKPAKTIFRRAAAKLRQNPACCLYVGDNLQVDAIAAVAQGGFAGGVWIDRADQPLPQPLPSGVHRITSLTQLVLLL